MTQMKHRLKNQGSGLRHRVGNVFRAQIPLSSPDGKVEMARMIRDYQG
jgi:hypothetical protein